MVHCRGEISSVIVLPGCSCSASPAVPEWVQEFVAGEQFHLMHNSMIHSIIVTSGNCVLEFEI